MQASTRRPATDRSLHQTPGSAGPFERILVALDFSTQSGSVLKAALAVADSCRSELVLVHAVTSAAELAYADPIAARVIPLELQAANASLAEMVAREPWMKCYKHQEIVEYGDPVDIIKELVVKQSIDLVIAGSHGGGGLDRLVLGSVAEAMMRAVSCPTLIVGPGARINDTIFRSLVLATDLRSLSSRVAACAFSLAQQFDSAMYVVHAVEPKLRHETHPELTDSVIRVMLERSVPPQLRASPKVHFRVEHGRSEDVVVKIAGAQRATMIFAGARKRSAWNGHSPWSKLSAIIRAAPCPVLLIHG